MSKTPRIAFVAHMDEIGYEVKKIEDDGRLQVEVLGGGYPQYFLGHVVLVHKKRWKPGWRSAGTAGGMGQAGIRDPEQAAVDGRAGACLCGNAFKRRDGETGDCGRRLRDHSQGIPAAAGDASECAEL